MKFHLSNASFATLFAFAYDLPSCAFGQVGMLPDRPGPDLPSDELPDRHSDDGSTVFNIDATLVFPRYGLIPDYATDKAYFFQGTDTYWKMDFWGVHSNYTDKWTRAKNADKFLEGPKSTSARDGFPGMPERIDATLIFDGYPKDHGVALCQWSWCSSFYPDPYPWYTKDMAYIFSGDEYWKWDLRNDKLEADRKKISLGFPGLPDNIDATFVFDRNYNYPLYTKDIAYIFKGAEYWEWNLVTDKLESGPRNINDRWEGLPDDIDATLYFDGKNAPKEGFDSQFILPWEENMHFGYFFKGTRYYQWDLIIDKLAKSGPVSDLNFPTPISSVGEWGDDYYK